MPMEFFYAGTLHIVYAKRPAEHRPLKAKIKSKRTTTSTEMFIEVCELIAHRYKQ